MIIAKEKVKTNIAEYIIYMWQIEDLIRACQFDIDTIDKFIISKMSQDPNTSKEIREWYIGLINQMRQENIKEKGHLQSIKNTITDITELHYWLLKKVDQIVYHDLYQKALPNIQTLLQKNKEQCSEIEICLNAVYGILMLRLQKKEISQETEKAIRTISNLLAVLSQKFIDLKKGELELD